MSPESGSMVESVPTTEPTAAFSAIVSPERPMSVGVELPAISAAAVSLASEKGSLPTVASTIWRPCRPLAR
jgi:hypothetical protein